MRALVAAVSAIIMAMLGAPAARAECALPEAAAGIAAPAVTLPRLDARAADAHVAARLLPAPPPLRLADEMPSTRAPSALTLTEPNPYKPYTTHTPAQGEGRAPLRPADVAAHLRARGFVDVSEVRQRGRAFLAEATGPRGERVRLVVDASSGEISGMQVIGFGPR